MLVLWIIVYLQLQITFSEVLNKIEVSKAKSKGAICNDGTPAVYYMNYNNQLHNWIIFFEGGSACNSFTSCQERRKNKPYFTSSKYYPSSVETRSLLSQATFKKYNKLLMIYCSSDFWLGNDSSIDRNAEKNLDKLSFRGKAIVNTILNDLNNKVNFSKTETLVLAGSSAGGIGLINHAEEIKKMFPFTQIKMVLDSAWFLNYNNFFRKNEDFEFMTYNGLIKNRLCQDFSFGFPCCLSAACILSKHSYVFNDIETMIVTSKYDIYILSEVLLNISKDVNDIEMKDVLMHVHEYGGEMVQSVKFANSKAKFSFIVPSCFQHVYFIASNLWENLYNPIVQYRYASITIKHFVDGSSWDTVSIGKHKISAIFNKWIKGNNSLKQISMFDKCDHAQCNPSCPQMIFFHSVNDDISDIFRIALILIILSIMLLCLIAKWLWCIKHIRLKRTQQKYLLEKYKEDPSGEQVTGIPPCALHNSVGIACSGLQYDIFNQNANQTQQAQSEEKQEKRRNKRYSIRNFRKSIYMNKDWQLKPIIKGVTAYFNPGQLVAIMGPSGSGKTTLLDVLTARKHFEETEKNIFINGLPALETRDWFIKNSGYVMQFASPYHEELTVRQNLTYSALMRLPEKMGLKEKMWRVEQVLWQTGLYESGDVIVGRNETKSSGLSGGQKRRLSIAMQLIDLPSVIFLDEPTSGLDSASSLELLETLHRITLSGRLVVVTIHQPRIEIFHMFNTILLLAEGKVAYFGSPIIAPGKMAETLQGCGKVFDASNPADSIMDVLTSQESQNIIIDHYHSSGEVEAINRAIERAKRHPQKTLSMKFQKQTSSINNRLVALDGRSTTAQTFSQKLYFPLIFLLYSLALGTCYWKTSKGVLLMSCYMVFSCASQLFMASAIHSHLNKALVLFELEKADGIGYSHEFAIHVFVRIFSQASLPLIAACIIIFLCTLHEYDMNKFFLTTLIHLQLNQAWIAIIMLTACATPRYSPLITPLLSAISGFAGGFLVPEPQMPMLYYWLFYVNPTHWAYSGMVNVLLRDITFKCKWNSPLECESSMGIVVLEQFGLNGRNPYHSMIVLLSMLIVVLVATVIVLEMKFSKRQFDQVTDNYFQGTRIKIVNFFTDIYELMSRKRKRMLEAEERERLMKLVEQKYEYKADPEIALSQTCATYVSSPETGKKMHYSYTDDTLDEASETSSKDEDTDPYIVKTKTKPPSILTKIQNNLPASKLSKLQDQRHLNEHQENTQVRMRSRSTLSRISKTIRMKKRRTYHGEFTDDENLIESNIDRPKSMCETYNTDSIDTKISNSVDGLIKPKEPVITKAESVVIQMEVENNDKQKHVKAQTASKAKKRRKRKTKDESRDTWSNYLDVKPKRHEVFCALSSVKRRIRAVNDKREKKINLQRKASNVILDERRKSMRFLLHELHKRSSASEYNTNKYRKRTLSSRRGNSIRSTNEKMSVESAELHKEESSEATIKRVSDLSFAQSQRTSETSSRPIASTSSTNEPTTPDSPFERERLMSVLRKLSTFDEDAKELIRESFSDSLDKDNTDPTLNDQEKLIENQEHDPLLPEEREIVQNLLSKHNMYLPPLPTEQIDDENSRLTYSSTVKIKGVSPSVSRKTSTVERPILENNNTVYVPPAMPTHSRIDEGDGLLDEPLLEEIRSVPHSSPIRRRRGISNTSKTSGRKISITVKSVIEQDRKEDNIANRESTFYSDVSSDSSSSDYESDVIKTEEGFIIPDDTINRVIANNARRESKSNQEQIEKQFKKDNFLKDRPVRRGIRMPIGSTGKVNLLKLKFEGKAAGKV